MTFLILSLTKKSIHMAFKSREGQTRITVEKREFARKFSQLSCSGQSRMRIDES